MHDADLGTLTRRGDRYRLTFTRHLSHAPDKVWRAVTEPEHLAVWFPDKIIGERTAGAPLRFEAANGDGFDGEMLVFEPPSVVEMMWGTDQLRIELAPDGDGTILTLVDTFGELGKAARDGAGWHECLDRLLSDLSGEQPSAWGEVWAAIHPAYIDALGPEASTIGPPADWEEQVKQAGSRA